MSTIDKYDLLEATNGGFDIFTELFPDIESVRPVGGCYKFKERTGEKTPSASIKKKGEIWLFNDFGNPNESACDAIFKWMRVKQIDNLNDAITEIVKTLALPIAGGNYKPYILKEVQYPSEALRERGYEYEEIKFTTYGLEILGPLVTPEGCKQYGFCQVKSYSFVSHKNGIKKYWCIEHTERYPMFVLDRGTFVKFYTPKNPEKSRRFVYGGSRPADYINGFNELKKQLEDYNPYTDDPDFIPEQVFLMSGERDAMNMAGTGRRILWMNSETSFFPSEVANFIYEKKLQVYIIPDIDSTGVCAAVKLANKHITFKTVWIPPMEGEYRGKPLKDFRDWVGVMAQKYGAVAKEIMRENILRDVDKLTGQALSFKFWHWNNDKKDYTLSMLEAYELLYRNGFCYMVTQMDEEVKIQELVRIQGNIVERVLPGEPLDFLKGWMKERGVTLSVVEKVMRSNLLDEKNIKKLPKKNICFKDFGDFWQYYFFTNEAWKVTADEITTYPYGGVPEDIYVPRQRLLPYQAKLPSDFNQHISTPFDITWDDQEKAYDINIKDKSSVFFRYLINTSRVHWRKETEGYFGEDRPAQKKYLHQYPFAIDGPNLSLQEIREQKQHLLNKIFVMGMHLHGYKSINTMAASWATDYRISENGQSNGRSGKSMFYEILRLFLPTVSQGGRNADDFRNVHWSELVTPATKLLFIDDADQNINFNLFYTMITGDMSVNKKFTHKRIIHKEDSPRIGISSNFPPKGINDSTSDRIIVMGFSDWYHIRSSDNDYQETRRVFNDFAGKDILKGSTKEEMEANILFMMSCLQFFIRTQKMSAENNEPAMARIEAPSTSLVVRQYIQDLGDHFIEWAELFFHIDRQNIGQPILKKEVIESFEQESKLKLSAKGFTGKMQKWIKYRNCVDKEFEWGFKNRIFASNKEYLLISRQDRNKPAFVVPKTEEEINRMVGLCKGKIVRVGFTDYTVAGWEKERVLLRNISGEPGSVPLETFFSEAYYGKLVGNDNLNNQRNEELPF